MTGADPEAVEPPDPLLDVADLVFLVELVFNEHEPAHMTPRVREALGTALRVAREKVEALAASAPAGGEAKL